MYGLLTRLKCFAYGGNIQVLDGDGIECTKQSDSDTAMMRHLAAQSIVLLKNDGALLPLKPKVCSFG